MPTPTQPPIGAEGAKVDEERILVNPSEELIRYMGTVSGGMQGMSAWTVGRISLGLQIETRRRVIATAVGNSMLHLSKEEICSVLTTVLVDAGLWDDVQVWYERLCDWKEERQIRFVPVTDLDGVSSDGPETEPSAGSASSEPSTPG
jgi:hypothetical protein